MSKLASEPLRIIFAGTPEFSVATLQALIASKHEVVGVYTQPDRPSGRGRKLTASPVKTLALALGLPIFQPATLKDETAQQQLAELKADVMVVVAYGLILPQIILDLPTYGCLNIHASILPRWRGAAPIQRAIAAGDAETGVTIMQMDAGLDTGDMLAILTTEITTDDTAQTLHDRLKDLGCQALLQSLVEIQTKKLRPIKQDESLVTYAEKMTKSEAEIDWAQSAEVIARKIQAFNPWPVAFTQYQNKSLRIWQAKVVSTDAVDEKIKNLKNLSGVVVAVQKSGVKVVCGTGILNLIQVQPTGKKPMQAYDFAQARQLTGLRLGSEPLK